MEPTAARSIEDEENSMPPPTAPVSAASLAEISLNEHVALQEKHQQLKPAADSVHQERYLLHPLDRSVVLDAQGRPLTLDRFLATKPLQSELCTRPGPGNKRLTYLAGDSVTRLLNEIFGYDGWNYEVRKMEKVEDSSPQQPHKFHVTYMAHVRITIKGGVYREDVGFGDAIDKQMSTAVAHAVKSAVTDALKRAARHFGDRLGNSLYDGQFSIKNAPTTLAQALDQYDQRLKERYNWNNHKKKPTQQQSTSAAQQQPVSGQQQQQSSNFAPHQQQPPKSSGVPSSTSLPVRTSHAPPSVQHQPQQMTSRPPLSTVSTNYPAHPPASFTGTLSTIYVAPSNLSMNTATSASYNRALTNHYCATSSTTIASLDLAHPHHHSSITAAPTSVAGGRPSPLATPLLGGGPSLATATTTTPALHAATVPPNATPGSLPYWQQQQHQPLLRPTTSSGRNNAANHNIGNPHGHQAVVTQNTPMSSLPAKRTLEQQQCDYSPAATTAVFVKKTNPYQQQQAPTSFSS